MGGGTVDASGYRPAGTLAVSVYAPCGELPGGFDEYGRPEADGTAR